MINNPVLDKQLKGTSNNNSFKEFEILLVEDNPGDVRLTIEAFKGSSIKSNLNYVMDGEDAIKYLNNEDPYAEAVRPDIILLDLNLPKKDGREVLSVVKQDPNLKSIPIIILTTSNAHSDIVKTYDLQANCYITKPVDFDQFTVIIKSIEDFWLNTVSLP